MKTIAFLTLLILFTQNAFAQGYNKDFYLVDDLILQKNTIGQKKLDSALTLYHKSTDPLEKIQYLNSWMMESLSANFLKPYNEFILQSLDSIEAKYENDEKFLREKHIALVFKNKIMIESGQYFEGIALAEEIEADEKLVDEEIKALNHVNIAMGYLQISDFEKSTENFFKALKMSEDLNSYELSVASLIGLGAVMLYQGDVEEGEKYSLRALEEAKESGNSNLIGAAYNNLGSFEVEKGNLEKAKEYYQNGMDLSQDYGDLEGVSTGYNNLGYMYYAYGELDSALIYYQKSVEIDKEINNFITLVSSLNSVAAIYTHLNKLDSALVYTDEVIQLAKEHKMLFELSYAYKVRYKVFKLKADFKSALHYFEQHRLAEDSLKSEENQNILSNQKAKYQYEKKKAIDDEKHAKEIAIEQEEKARQKLLLYSITIGAFMLLFFAVIIFNRLRITKKQKQIISNQKLEVEEQKEIVEEKNREILDSITYAKRIQSAILPPDKMIKEKLPESFVLYKPKDIVAGDFYWLEVSNENLTLLAAADCTGHGVPGALVSVVCNNSLNRSVREFGLTDPGKILDKTKELVIQEFEKSQEDVKDGMDIALVALTQNENQNENDDSHSSDSFSVCYSGAHNPLWIIRKGSNEVEEIKAEFSAETSSRLTITQRDNLSLIEVKADKQPVGVFDASKDFSTHKVDLNKGDTVYIFSDGYADQFGGDKGKKMKAKNFKNLLLSIQDQNMDQQMKSLDKAFEDWKGQIEQLDDVCVIGIRV